MAPYNRFEIFRKVPGGEPEWVESCASLESAKDRARESAATQPDEYFIFDRENRLFLEGPQNRPVRTGTRVLVADDSEMTRRTVCELLRGRSDLRIVGQASNGREAIDEARKLRPDLIIMDWAMPQVDGVTAAQVIKKFSPHTAILIFSVHTGRVFEQFAKSIGLEGFATKGSQELLAAVDAILDNRVFFHA